MSDVSLLKELRVDFITTSSINISLLTERKQLSLTASAGKAAEELSLCLRAFVVNLRHETTTTLAIDTDLASGSFLFLIRNSVRRAADNTAGAASAFGFTAARATHALNPR